MLTKLYVKADVALRSFVKDRQGVTAVEYAIIAVAIGGIAAAVFTSGGSLQTAVQNAMTTVEGYL